MAERKTERIQDTTAFQNWREEVETWIEKVYGVTKGSAILKMDNLIEAYMDGDTPLDVALDYQNEA